MNSFGYDLAKQLACNHPDWSWEKLAAALHQYGLETWAMRALKRRKVKPNGKGK